MFNPRKSDDTVSVSPAKPVTPHIAYSAPRPMPEDNYSIINEWLTMKGDLESEGDILVKGKVLGNINCKILIIDVGAVIDGGIVAEDVVVRGRTKGMIDAKRIRLEKTAVVDSEIAHEVFSAEEGARIKGALRFKDGTAPAPAKVETKPAAAMTKMAAAVAAGE